MKPASWRSVSCDGAARSCVVAIVLLMRVRACESRANPLEGGDTSDGRAVPRSGLDSDHALFNRKPNYVGSAVKVEFLHHVLAM